MTAREVEIGVADKFNYRQNVIVPNVSWGIGLRYEADLVVLRPSGYAVEVEIKVNASDIKADLKKRHQHDSKLFRELWFAVPEELAEDPNIPARAGIFAVKPTNRMYHPFACRTVRRGRMRRDAVKWSTAQREKVLHLAAMRTWTLKLHLYDMQRRIKEK